MDISTPIFTAFLGGLAAQGLTVADGLAAPADRKPDFKSFSYYIAILINISLSTILGYIYFDEAQPVNKIVYFHIGASAPVLLRTLITTIPEVVRHNSQVKTCKSK